MHELNRRSMDPIAAKVWFAEILRAGRGTRRCPTVGLCFCHLSPVFLMDGSLVYSRLFLSAQHTAALRHDDDTQASLINRCSAVISIIVYTIRRTNPCQKHHSHLRLVTHSLHAITLLGTHQGCAIELYCGPHESPTSSQAGPTGEDRIRILPSSAQLFVVVELLMGDIPDHGTSRHPVPFRKRSTWSLFRHRERFVLVYFSCQYSSAHTLTHGCSLSEFQATLAKHISQFGADRTYTLIVRLRQNVIKTGIRRLSLSYSRVLLRDICLKLHLDSEEDAEYIVGKAIRDGVIGCP